MTWFAHIGPDAAVGGKARSLAELGTAGLPTPPGFVVTDILLRTLCPELAPVARLDQVALRRLDGYRERIARAPWPDGFLAALDSRLNGLAAERFAVRSSFVLEDAPGRLAAGVYESRVAVPRDGVASAIREVLASAVAPGAIAYALAHGTVPTAGPFAVLVHRYAEGEAEGSAALAEATGEVVLAIRRGALPAPVRDELARALRRLVRGRGSVEVEWGWSGGQLVFLQARPFAPPPPPAPWPGWADLRPGDPPAAVWRWDAAHNPLPLSPAQAGLVELVDGVCTIGIRQRVLGGYLFYVKDERPLPVAIPPDEAEAYFARLQADVEARLATLAGSPGLDDALDLFVTAYQPIFGVLQPALRAAQAALGHFLSVHAPDHAQLLPVLRSGVPSLAAERLARSARLAAAATAHDREVALADYLARFGDESPTWDVSAPTYAEVPSLLSPGSRAAHGEGTAWRAASDVVAGGLPAELRPVWDATLALARTAVALGEADDWLFARTQAAVRRALLVEGRRWAARRSLSDPADVFWLPLALVRRLAEGEAAVPGLAVRVAAARHGWQDARLHPPPLRVAGDARAVRGLGVGGRAIGRVVHHVPGAGTGVARDAVLVAKTLLPTELPLLDAAALVTETGGLLDHVAAQARERKLAAVVGAAGALHALHEGALVLVDGDLGLVVSLDEPG